MEKEKLLQLLENEEKLQGVKMGYTKFCSRSGDWFWNDDCINHHNGMIKDLIEDETISREYIEELIDDKFASSADGHSCCESYYAVKVKTTNPTEIRNLKN